MEIKKNIETKHTTLHLSGEVDAVSAIELDSQLKTAFGEGAKNILLDCKHLTYISSAGLGVFISYIKALESNKNKIILYHIEAGVLSTFEILGLHHIITIVETKEIALELCS